MIFAQFFHNSTGYDIKTNTFSADNVRPIEMCGSDGVLVLDGRRSYPSWIKSATEIGNKRGALGFTLHKGESFSRSTTIMSYHPIDKVKESA